VFDSHEFRKESITIQFHPIIVNAEMDDVSDQVKYFRNSDLLMINANIDFESWVRGDDPRRAELLGDAIVGKLSALEGSHLSDDAVDKIRGAVSRLLAPRSH